MTDTVTQAAQQIEATATELGLRMDAVFIPFSQSRNKNEKHKSLNWRIELFYIDINDRLVIVTEYSAGCGHCPSYRQMDNSLRHQEMVDFECERGREAKDMSLGLVGGKPILPSFAEVIHSLVNDAIAIDYSGFEDWAAEYGHSTDSRKAETTYKACLAIGLALRNAVGDVGIRKLQDVCQYY